MHAGVDSYFPIIVILVMFLQFKQFPETLALCGICRFFLWKLVADQFVHRSNCKYATDRSVGAVTERQGVSVCSFTADCNFTASN